MDGFAVFAVPEVTAEGMIAFEENALDKSDGEESDGVVSVSKELLDISDKLAGFELADETP